MALKPQDLKARKADIATVAILLLAAFIGYSLIYAPSEKRKASMKARLQEIKEKNALLAEVDVLYRAVDKLEQGLTARRDEGWLIAELHSIAARAEVKILSTDPRPRQVLGNYVKIAVKLDAESGYHNLGNLISQLENSANFLKIETLSIESAETGMAGPEAAVQAPAGLTNISMTVVTYFKAR